MLYVQSVLPQNQMVLLKLHQTLPYRLQCWLGMCKICYILVFRGHLCVFAAPVLLSTDLPGVHCSLQIQQLLPKLAGTEYVISPSAWQLAMLVRSGGPSELKRVANFTVMHKAWGSVRWLEPVDVRSLPLKAIVQIAHRNVDVSTPHTMLLEAC